MRGRRDLPFDEWNRIQKAPRAGGAQSPISPGFGMTGPYGGANGIPGPGFQGPSGGSRYADARPDGQPVPWIEDVDGSTNFFSPFQPVWPFGPPNIASPREWDYPVGYNINFIQPRMESMSMLRGMARTWGVLATIIATRMDQLLTVPWTVQLKDRPQRKSAGVEEMKRFLKSPDGKLKYTQWSRKLLFDLLELDAPCLYNARNRGGKIIGVEVLNGQTIFPLIDDAGRRPDSVVEISEDGLTYLRRQPAFQQIIKGLPMVDLDESEITYAPMRPRPDMPMFGYPGTEQIIVESSEAIRKTFYQLDFWKDGNIPDLIITVPDSWSPRQIAMFQAHNDALLSGNLSLKSKMRFVPGGMKPFDIKNSSGESLWSQRDETLIRLACYAYSVSATPFIKAVNRSTAQAAAKTAKDEGLYPLMGYWKDVIIDPIIERCGYDDIEMVYLPEPEQDQEKKAKIHDTKIKSGEFSVNEARAEDGYEPVPGGDGHNIYVGNAIIPLAVASKGGALPSQGGSDNVPGGQSTRTPNSSSRPSGSMVRGPARPNNSAAPVEKLTRGELREAERKSDGDLESRSMPQLVAGNYPKGHVRLHGLNISIENATGSLRGKKNHAGVHEWSVRMPAPYGYIRGTVGADDDQIDVFIGRKPKSKTVWVIDQRKVSKKGKVKKFDEHKVMFGYKSLKAALKDYLRTHDDHGSKRIESITELSVDEFKAWLREHDTREPMAESGLGIQVSVLPDLVKLDTISSSTNLTTYELRPRKRKRKKRRAQGPRWLELSA